jgi:putative serine protease PepD
VDREEWAEEPNEDHPTDPVLPPEQRWWRHPSELGATPPDAGVAVSGRPPSRAPLVLAGTIGVIGALLAGLLVRATVSEPDGQTAIDATSLALPRAAASLTSSAALTAPAPTTAPTVPPTTTAAATPVLVALDVRAPAAVVNETYVLAAASDLGEATEATLVLPSGEEHAAHVVVTDEVSGVALLQVQVPLTTLATGSASELVPGDVVRSADGNAGELLEIVAWQPSDQQPSRPLLRVRMAHDVATGTPLYDGKGRAIGFCVGSGDDGSVMVLPIEIARRLAEEAAAGETRAVPWLGIKGRNESDAGGARIVKVFPGGPAAGAGLRADDVVVALNGVAVRSMGSLVLLLGAQAAGETITLTVERDDADDGAMVDVPVELGTVPIPSSSTAPPSTEAPPTTAATTSTEPTVPPPTSAAPPTTPAVTVPPERAERNTRPVTLP